ncbi:MAG TPA: glycoside hydrolase domain-containing protein [Puia sp.]
MDGAEKNLHAEVADWDFDRVREHAAALWDQALGKIRVTGGTVESNPYQQGWFVPQDIPGMVKLMGGREAVIKDLQHFFQQTPENMLWNNYYNHANEPVHHVPSFSIGWERPG